MDEKHIKEILEDFYSKASSEEKKTLEKLLQERNLYRRPININGDKMATEMARSIKEQLGVTTENILGSAREIVRTMILQYDPYILNDDLNALIDHMVPQRKKVRIQKSVLLAMVTHFIQYSTGRMSDQEISELPAGWTEKYWNNFPEDMQRLIAAFLKEKISEKEFWEMAEVLAGAS